MNRRALCRWHQQQQAHYIGACNNACVEPFVSAVRTCRACSDALTHWYVIHAIHDDASILRCALCDARQPAFRHVIAIQEAHLCALLHPHLTRAALQLSHVQKSVGQHPNTE